MVANRRDGRFKVGTTDGALDAYVRKLEHTQGTRLELIGHFAEGRDRERAMQKALAQWRLDRGEWFDLHEHSEEDAREYLRLHGGALGWPRPRAKAPRPEMAETETVAHVQVTLPGFAYPRRPKSYLLRSILDQRPTPTSGATEEVSYYTPSVYVEAARRVMGGIDLDPASCEEANKTVGAAVFYDEAEDGLKQSWSGRVFLSPPWSGAASRFVTILLNSYRAGKVDQAVLVVNAAYTDRRYMRDVLASFPVCFTDHRVRFGAAGRNSTGGTMFVYFGKHVQRFVNAFTEFGPVFLRLQASAEKKGRAAP